MADKKISQLTGATTPLAGTEVLPIVQSSTTKKVASDDLTVKNIRSNTTNGILQVTGPAAAATRTMTVPDANFTAARTDASQTFTGTQTFSVMEAGSQATVGTTIGDARIDIVNSTTHIDLQSSRFGIGYSYPMVLQRLGGNLAIGNITSPTEKVEITDNVKLTTGNLVVGTAGKGIDFSANTHAAGMTSELLNDYEEGTWTPTVTSAAGTVTLVDGSGCTYTKVGRMVYVFARIGITTDASVGTSDLTIAGLPYTVYQYGSANLSSSSYSVLDFGTGGAHGIVIVTSTSLLHLARTVDISSRGSTFYWSYSAVYSV